MLATDTGGTARLSLFKFCVFRDWIIMRPRVGARERDQCVSLQDCHVNGQIGFSFWLHSFPAAERLVAARLDGVK